MRVIFFWKCWKFNLDLKNAPKNPEKYFSFWDKCIWTVSIELCLLRTEYLPLAVCVLTNSLKIFHVTKSHFFQFNYLHSDQWIWYTYCRWDWISVLAQLLCWLSRGLSNGNLQTCFGVWNSEIHKLWESSFLKMFKI